MSTEVHASRYPGNSAPGQQRHGQAGFSTPLRRVITLGALALGLLAVAYLVVCAYMAQQLTKGNKGAPSPQPETYGLAYEPAAFPSRIDGIPLDGWLLEPPASVTPRRPIIVVHGRASSRTREANGHMLEIAAQLVRDGHRVLMFDLRGSGLSGGERYTFGVQEVRDVGGAVDFLAQRGLTSNGVDLLGYSMGGATALLFAPNEPLVHMVAEDSGYAELGDLIDTQVPKFSGLPGVFTAGMVFFVKPLVGVDMYAVRPIDAVPTLAAHRVPLLVIHGEADSTVTVEHGRRIAAAYGAGVDTLFVPTAEHVASFEVEQSSYMARLTAFFDRAE